MSSLIHGRGDVDRWARALTEDYRRTMDTLKPLAGDRVKRVAHLIRGDIHEIKMNVGL